MKDGIGFQRGGYTGEHVGSPKRPVTSRYTEQYLHRYLCVENRYIFHQNQNIILTTLAVFFVDTRGHREINRLSHPKLNINPRVTGGGRLTPPPPREYSRYLKNERRYRRETWQTFSYNNSTSSLKILLKSVGNFLRYGRFCDVTTRHFW